MMRAMAGTRVEIKTHDGIADAHVFTPNDGASGPGIVLYMDGIGVRHALFDMAEDLAGHGYCVLLPNMFYRHGPFEPFDPKTVFKGPGPERDRLMAIIKSVDVDRAMSDTAAFLGFLDGRPEVKGKGYGTVGYCMGGSLAIAAAGTYPDQVLAAASFHGARLATDAPNSPHLLAQKMRARIYIGVADNDAGHPPEATEKLEAAFGAAGVRHQIELYPGALHGWVPSDTPVHDEAATERGWIISGESTLLPGGGLAILDPVPELAVWFDVRGLLPASLDATWRVVPRAESSDLVVAEGRHRQLLAGEVELRALAQRSFRLQVAALVNAASRKAKKKDRNHHPCTRRAHEALLDLPDPLGRQASSATTVETAGRAESHENGGPEGLSAACLRGGPGRSRSLLPTQER
jgi:carboxymethylenebutenolidase